MSFRREEKIHLTAFERQQLQQKLQRQGMQPLYPPRMVHSLYLDNHARQILYDAEEGVLPRKKRLRHYDHVEVEATSVKCKTRAPVGSPLHVLAVSSPTPIAELADHPQFIALVLEPGLQHYHYRRAHHQAQPLLQVLHSLQSQYPEARFSYQAA